jgi:hypothetical protein
LVSLGPGLERPIVVLMPPLSVVKRKTEKGEGEEKKKREKKREKKKERNDQSGARNSPMDAVDFPAFSFSLFKLFAFLPVYAPPSNPNVHSTQLIHLCACMEYGMRNEERSASLVQC